MSSSRLVKNYNSVRRLVLYILKSTTLWAYELKSKERRKKKEEVRSSDRFENEILDIPSRHLEHIFDILLNNN